MTNKPSSGKRAGTRSMFKTKREITVNEVLSTYDLEEKVQINIQGSFHRGFPFRRFQGLTGSVSKKRGDCYEVTVKKPGAKKTNTVIVHPVHLKRVNEKATTPTPVKVKETVKVSK
jgi:large subunit ribosomal protein L21e